MQRIGISLMVTAVCLTCLSVNAQLLGGMGGKTQVQGATLPLYSSGPGKELMAMVKVDKTYLDHEQRLFFRIGALPMEVMEGVTIEVYHPERLTNGLERVAKWVTPSRAKRLELRKVKVVIGQDHLEAAKIHFAPGGQWDLADGIAFFSGTNVWRSSAGTFQTTGPRAGEVILKGKPVVTNWFSVPAEHSR